MKCVELFGAPQLLRISRKAHSSNLRSGREFLRVKTFPFPLTVNDRVAQCAAMGRAYCFAVIGLLVFIRVTPGTGIQRRLERADGFPFMLRMTIDTAQPGLRVRPGDGADKGVGRMTGSTR